MKELVVAASSGLLFACQAYRDMRMDPATWPGQMHVLANAGFSAVDLSELWLPMADLSDSQVRMLADAIAGAGLEIAGVSIVNVNLGDPDQNDSARDKVLRAIEVTHRLGAPFLSVGLHALPEPGGKLPPRWCGDDAELARIGARLTPLAEVAADAEIALSLEMFERGVLDRSANVLGIIAAAQRKNIGANPDLANLLRAPWPLVESWEQTFVSLVPKLNYWHVKNGMRMLLPDGTAIYQPTDVGSGNIDYRTAVHQAVRGGFRGPLLIEHYGGDAISIAASGRIYLERLIAEVCAFEGIEIRELTVK